MGSVADGIGFALGRMIQEPVDQDRTVGRYADSGRHIIRHAFIIIHDFHAASAENVGRTHHDGIADAVRDRDGILYGDGHAGFGHRDLQLLHHLTEQIPVFRQIDDSGRGAEDLHAVLFQIGCEIQRCLAAELGDHAERLFLIIDAQNIFQGERLEIQLVGSIIVGGNGLGVAVHDDRLETELLQRQCRMDAAVVELNTLADPVGAAAEDHDLRLFGTHRVLVRRIVGRIVISGILGAGYVYAFPGLLYAERQTAVADVCFRYAEHDAEVLVGETVLLCLGEGFVRRKRTMAFCKRRFFLYQFLHLLDEPFLHVRKIIELIYGRTLLQRFVHREMTFAAGRRKQLQQLFFGFRFQLFDMSETVSACFQGTYGFLEGFLVILADAHDFADSTHLGAELVFHAFELFECPAGEFDHDIVAVRHIFIQRAVFAAGNVGQIQAGREHCGNERDREAGRLAGECGRSGSTGIDLNNNDTITDGIVCELNIGAADDLHGIDDLVSLLLQTFLDFFGNGKHGSGTEGISCMNAHGIDVLNKADRDHIACGITYDFQLELFPAEDGFFDEHLADQGSLQASGADGLQLFLIIYKTAAGTAHGVGRTEDDRITEFIGDRKCFFHGIGDLRAGHLNAERVHGILELDPVFTALNGVHLNTDDLDIVFIKNAFFGKLCCKIEAGLSAEIGKKGIGTFFCDDLLQTFYIQGLDIRNVGSFGIGHDGCGIGIDKNDFISELAKSFACLGAGIVELTSLSDDDRTGADDQHFVDICSFWHRWSLL